MSTLLASKVKARAKAKVRETLVIVDRRGIFPESVPTSREAKAKAKDSKDSVTTAARRAIPQVSAPKAKKEESQKEKETATQEKAEDRGVRERGFGRRMEKNLKDTGSGSSRRRKSQLETFIRLGMWKRTSTRRLRDDQKASPQNIGQHTPDIFAVDAERSWDSTTK